MGSKLEEICREFCINNYSSVGTVIERKKQKAITDRKLKLPVVPHSVSNELSAGRGMCSLCIFRKRVGHLKLDLMVSKEQT
jgi:hypothetical protein